MDKIFRGILKYSQSARGDLIKRLSKVKNDGVVPSAVFVTCVDSRLLPSQFTNTEAGDMFVIRNAGNFVPHSCCANEKPMTATEPAVFELGCAVSSVKNVIVCGHSDCKAMSLLHTLMESPKEGWSEKELLESPLKGWLQAHGLESLKTYTEMKQQSFNQPVSFLSDTKNAFHAFIDNSLDESDKLSQINTLVQMKNVSSYDFMKKRIEDREATVHGMWFDVNSGNVSYFSKPNKKFVVVSNENANSLIESEM